MQIGRLMRLAVAAFLAMGCLALGWNELRFRGIANADREQTTEVEAMRLLKDMRYHVVQIQQFLTDVSATRGLSGLDDGWTEADKNAQAFQRDVQHAQDLAKSLNAQELATALAAVEAQLKDRLLTFFLQTGDVVPPTLDRRG